MIRKSYIFGTEWYSDSLKIRRFSGAKVQRKKRRKRKNKRIFRERTLKKQEEQQVNLERNNGFKIGRAISTSFEARPI